MYIYYNPLLSFRKPKQRSRYTDYAAGRKSEESRYNSRQA